MTIDEIKDKIKSKKLQAVVLGNERISATMIHDTNRHWWLDWVDGDGVGHFVLSAVYGVVADHTTEYSLDELPTLLRYLGDLRRWKTVAIVPVDNDPAPVLTEIMSWVAWNVENFGADGTYHSVDLLPNINLDGLGKWLRVRKGVVHFRLAWWQLLAQDNPAVYHRALRNMILAKAQLSKPLNGIQNTSYEKKRRRAYRRLDRIYRTVSRYKFGVE